MAPKPESAFRELERQLSKHGVTSYRPGLRDEVEFTCPCPVGGKPHKVVISGLFIARSHPSDVVNKAWAIFECGDECQVLLGPAGRPRFVPEPWSDELHEGHPFR